MNGIGRIHCGPMCEREVGFVTMWPNISDDGHGNSDEKSSADEISRVSIKTHEQSAAASEVGCYRRLRSRRAGLEAIKRARQLTAPASPDR